MKQTPTQAKHARRARTAGVCFTNRAATTLGMGSLPQRSKTGLEHHELGIVRVTRVPNGGFGRTHQRCGQTPGRCVTTRRDTWRDTRTHCKTRQQPTNSVAPTGMAEQRCFSPALPPPDSLSPRGDSMATVRRATLARSHPQGYGCQRACRGPGRARGNTASDDDLIFRRLLPTATARSENNCVRCATEPPPGSAQRFRCHPPRRHNRVPESVGSPTVII
jgi:hypothetical protein